MTPKRSHPRPITGRPSIPRRRRLWAEADPNRAPSKRHSGRNGFKPPGGGEFVEGDCHRRAVSYVGRMRASSMAGSGFFRIPWPPRFRPPATVITLREPDRFARISDFPATFRPASRLPFFLSPCRRGNGPFRRCHSQGRAELGRPRSPAGSRTEPSEQAPL